MKEPYLYGGVLGQGQCEEAGARDGQVVVRVLLRMRRRRRQLEGHRKLARRGRQSAAAQTMKLHRIHVNIQA